MKPPPESGNEDDWISGYVHRLNDLLRAATQAGQDLADEWGERSLTGDEWTATTMTADAIDASDRITPLVGEGIDLWLELVQRSYPRRGLTAGEPAPTPRPPPGAGRVDRYIALWDAADRKLAAGAYRAEDLVEDWFAGVGLAARDAMAALTLVTGRGRAEPPPEDDGVTG